MWLLECHRIHFKYSKLFWSLWSFFAFEKRRLSFLFRRITSIKQPKCFTLERLNHRNACSDTHACNTFISAPACLCNISVSYYYLKFANLEHDLGCMAHWEFAGSERKWTQVSVSEPQRETCWLPTLHIETLDQSLTPTNTYKRYTGNKGNNTFTYFSLHSENKQANKRINDWCHFPPWALKTCCASPQWCYEHGDTSSRGNTSPSLIPTRIDQTLAAWVYSGAGSKFSH